VTVVTVVTVGDSGDSCDSCDSGDSGGETEWWDSGDSGDSCDSGSGDSGDSELVSLRVSQHFLPENFCSDPNNSVLGKHKLLGCSFGAAFSMTEANSFHLRLCSPFN
jgi:hypothetical protein